jgi:hypothetical protein
LSEEQTALPLGPIQSSIPGLEDAGRKPRRRAPEANQGPLQNPLMVAARDEDDLPEWPLHPVSPDQLTLETNQDPLPEAEEQPVQLSLLPDPALWETPEADDPPKPTKGRLARKRARRGISPGQRSLF